MSEIREIPLSQGLVAIVDAEDYEELSRFKWSASEGRVTFYATRRADGSRRTTISMHRDLLSAPRGIGVDHRNGNGLDNRRSNLRLATALENCANRRIIPGTFKGITLIPEERRSKAGAARPWAAAIKVHRVSRFLGHYATPEEAARAYDRAAYDAWGPFANLNFPGEPLVPPFKPTRIRAAAASLASSEEPKK